MQKALRNRMRRRPNGFNSIVRRVPVSRTAIEEFLRCAYPNGVRRDLTMGEIVELELLFFTSVTPNFVTTDVGKLRARLTSDPDALERIEELVVTLWHQVHSQAEDRQTKMTATIARLMGIVGQEMVPKAINDSRY